MAEREPHVLPCPFCGHTETGIITQHELRVVCRRCLATGPSLDATELVNAEDAIQQWNKRAAV